MLWRFHKLMHSLGTWRRWVGLVEDLIPNGWHNVSLLQKWASSFLLSLDSNGNKWYRLEKIRFFKFSNLRYAMSLNTEEIHKTRNLNNDNKHDHIFGCFSKVSLVLCTHVSCDTEWNRQASKLKFNTALIIVHLYSALGYDCWRGGHALVT